MLDADALFCVFASLAERNIISVPVCLSASISQKPRSQTPAIFCAALCVLYVVVATRYVLPVFSDDIIFSRNGPYGSSYILRAARE